MTRPRLIAKGFGVPGMTPAFALRVPGIGEPRPAREQDFRFRVVVTPEAVVQGLGLDRHVESAVISAIHAASGMNALQARTVVSSTVLQLNVDPSIRAVILERAAQLFGDNDPGRALADALVKRGLSKADPRGGKYHARVPQEGGGYRYYYDEDRYARREDAHLSGKSILMRKCSDTIMERVGDEGCTVDDAIKAATGYDDETIKDSIRDAVKRGRLVHDGGKLKTTVKARA